MANNTPNAVPPVRVLKKVRRQFLHKTPEEVEPNDDASANNHNLMNESDITKETIEALKHSKKLCIEAEELNSYFHVTSALIESRRTSRVVTLNLCRNDGAPMPWEHTARKLESLGDLESATWALRIRTSLLDYVKAMTSFHEMLKSEDPLVQATLRKTQRRAVLACREIEEKYSFQKYLQHLRRDTYELLSCHYTDGFIQEIGHTPETFLSWSRENGIPKIFETNNEFYQNLLKEFLSFLPLVTQPIREGERMEIIIYDKDGMQQKMRIKTISVFEPNPAMSFHHWYIAVDKDPIVVAVQAAAQGAQEQQNDPELQLKKRIEDADETKENTEQ